MSTFTRSHSVEWVCVDCHLAIAGYSAHEVGHPLPTPWADDPSVEDVTNGSPPDECETHGSVDWHDWPDSWHDLHSECDHDSFSLHPCGGCGSALAGDRYAVTLSLLDWTEQA